ncbi:MAG: hypothetical protein L0H93_05865 [Nocardioides sp.]|nr:hypothetical protein [Nocardioides sp.]
MKQKLALGLTATLAALALTACGSDDSSSDSEGSETPSATESASEEESEDAEAEPETEETETEETEAAADTADADLTPAGEELSIGDTATVTDEDGLVVKLTVSEIEEGTSAQLKELNLKEDPNKYTPFFVKVTGEVVSGDASGYDPSTDLTGMIGEQPATHLIEFTSFDPCNGESFDSEVKPGDTLDSCTIQLASKGETVDGVMFDSSDTDYDVYDGEPLFWR